MIRMEEGPVLAVVVRAACVVQLDYALARLYVVYLQMIKI